MPPLPAVLPFTLIANSIHNNHTEQAGGYGTEFETTFRTLESLMVQPGTYRHYKGNTYQVLGVAKHSETEEDLVVYRALYGKFGLWVRPLEMFCEQVQFEGKSLSRFELIPQEK